MGSGPKYIQVKERLESDIRSGVFETGKLPAFIQLGDQYGVSLMTISKVVKLLEEEGLVTCHAGARGTLINKAMPVSRLGVDQDGEINLLPFVHEKVKLRYANLDYSEATKQMWHELARDFNNRYPWIEVEFVPMDSLLDGGFEEVDVIQAGGQDLNWLRENVSILALDNFLNCDQMISPDSFLPEIWEKCCLDNMLMALPMTFSVPLLFYRRELMDLDERDVLVWSDFEALIKIVREHGSDVSLNIGLWTFWRSFLGDIGHADIVRADVRKRMEESISLIEKTIEATENRYELCKVYQQRDIIKKFLKGDVSLFCGYSFYLSSLVKDSSEDWRAQVIPLEKDGQVAIQALVNAIGSNSKYRREAWLFIRFLSSEEVARNMIKYNQIPARKNEMEESLGNNGNIRDPERLIERIKAGIVFDLSSHALYVVYNQMVYPALNDYLNGVIDLNETIERIDQCFSEVLPVYLVA